MIKEVIDLIREFISRLIGSRLVALGLVFSILFSVLAVRLFKLQILEGDK